MMNAASAQAGIGTHNRGLNNAEQLLNGRESPPRYSARICTFRIKLLASTIRERKASRLVLFVPASTSDATRRGAQNRRAREFVTMKGARQTRKSRASSELSRLATHSIQRAENGERRARCSSHSGALA